MSQRGWQVHVLRDVAKLAQDCLSMLPGCLLLDVTEGYWLARKLLRQVGRRRDARPIICLSAHADAEPAVEAMKRGAFDFLFLPVKQRELAASVLAALRVQRLLFAVQQNQALVERRLADLTPRERQVLAGMIQGQSNKRMAFEMKLSQRTIETHRKRVMDKFEANNLADLCRMMDSCHRCVYLPPASGICGCRPTRCCHLHTSLRHKA